MKKEIGIYSAIILSTFGLMWSGVMGNRRDKDADAVHDAGSAIVSHRDLMGVDVSEPDTSRTPMGFISSWGEVCISPDAFVYGVHPLEPNPAPGTPSGVDPYGVLITRGEFPPGGGIPEEDQVEYSTSYQVIGTDLLWTKDLLVVGQTDAGASIVELWVFPPVSGEWRAEAVGAGTAVGIPASTMPSHTELIVGGGYIPQVSRARRGRVRRSVLYRSSGLEVLSACLDRDLRCAYLLGRDASGAVGLYLLDLAISGPPQLVLDPQSYPELVAATAVTAVVLPGTGRALMIDLASDLAAC